MPTLFVYAPNDSLNIMIPKLAASGSSGIISVCFNLCPLIFLEPPQLGDSDIKKEVVVSNSQENKLPDEYLSTGHEFANQDPDELMTNEESHKKSENIEDGNLQDNSNSVKVHSKGKLLVYHKV